MNTDKIVAFTEINKRTELKSHSIVLTGGCFDLFHYGHWYFLHEAKKAGDMLVVALESDDFIIHKKKKNPVHNQQQRALILSSIDVVDLIIMLPFFKTDEEYDNMVKAIHPLVIAVTNGDPQLRHKHEQSRMVQGRILEVNALKEFSSSNIIRQYETFFGN